MGISYVREATPYVVCNLGSFGKANMMLLRQFNFPHCYDDQKDFLSYADHDRLVQWDSRWANDCFKRHTGTGDLGFENWLMDAKNEQIFAFLKDILRVSEDQVIRQWTGYRILGSVHLGNGYPVYTLQLFAKGKDSKTVVYTGEKAPNVAR